MLEAEFVREVEDLAHSEAFDEVLVRLEDSFIGKWKMAKTADEREKAHALVMALDAIRTEIASIATDKRFVAFNTRRSLRQVKT